MLRVFRRTVIGPRTDPLLIRYILFRINAVGAYLHHLCRSDYDRALHDHPWPFVSFVLSGGYWEIHDQVRAGEPAANVWHGPGSVLVRPAQWRHRFVLAPNTKAWTLVIVGRRCQRWGFYLPDGWCWWRKHDDQNGICSETILHTGGRD